MSSNVREDYLVTEVMTATPQKLQLMLIEGAIRLLHKAREHWHAHREEQAGEALIRAQQIITEMMCGLKPSQDPELVRRVGAVYLFVFRALVTAHLEHSEVKLSEALSILQIERDTWRQVCDQLVSARALPEEGETPFSPASFVT